MNKFNVISIPKRFGYAASFEFNSIFNSALTAIEKCESVIKLDCSDMSCMDSCA